MKCAVFVVVMLQLASCMARSLPTGAKRRPSRNIDPLLEQRSNTVPDVSTSSTSLADLPIPSYLKEVYEKLSLPDGTSRVTVRQEELQGNTIHSYENLAKNASCGFYQFKVDKLQGEDIIRAELRLLQKNHDARNFNRYTVKMYYLLRKEDQASPLKVNFKHARVTSGWKIFDITPVVESWKQGWVNYGLKVEITDENGQVIPCDQAPLQFSRGGSGDPNNSDPFLVVFTEDHNSKFFSEVLMEEEVENYTKTNQRRKRTVSITKHKPCHLQDLEVKKEVLNTEHLEFMHPSAFQVGRCEGRCPDTWLGTETDHAAILSMHYKHLGKSQPQRCCVPTQFQTVNFLLYNNLEKEFIVKTNVPVTATKCSCL